MDQSNNQAQKEKESETQACQLISVRRGKKRYRVSGQSFEIDDCYSLIDVIGHGSYGVVCSAVDNRTSEKVAIKRISRVFGDLIDGRRIWREIFILRTLNENHCRGVLNLYNVRPSKETIADYRDIYIITDFYDIDLNGVIRSEKGPISFIKNVGARVLRSLADMHAMGIIHRDIKPNNILLKNKKGEEDAVICDFGLARAGMDELCDSAELSDYVVTRWYRPPELLLMCHYSYPVDIWAVGCVLAEYVMRQPLFPGSDYIHQLQLVLSTIPITGTSFIEESSSPCLAHIREIEKKSKGSRSLSDLLSNLGRDGLDLVRRLLEFEPSKRLTALEALQHKFFESAEVYKDSDFHPKPELDLGFDMHANISEAQLRRAIWNEIEYFEKKSAK